MGHLQASVADRNLRGFTKGRESPSQAFTSVLAFVFQFMLPRTVIFVQKKAHLGNLREFPGVLSCQL